MCFAFPFYVAVNNTADYSRVVNAILRFVLLWSHLSKSCNCARHKKGKEDISGINLPRGKNISILQNDKQGVTQTTHEIKPDERVPLHTVASFV